MKRFLQDRRWLALGMVAGLLLLLMASPIIWHFASDSAWVETKRALEAEGEIFDAKSLTPPEIPDAENFAATPVLTLGSRLPAAILTAPAIYRPMDAKWMDVDKARVNVDWPAVKTGLEKTWPEIVPVSPPAKAVLLGMDRWKKERDELLRPILYVNRSFS